MIKTLYIPIVFLQYGGHLLEWGGTDEVSGEAGADAYADV